MGDSCIILIVLAIVVYIVFSCAVYGDTLPRPTALVVSHWLDRDSIGDYVPEGNDLDYSPLGRKAMVNFRDYAASVNLQAATVWGRNKDILLINQAVYNNNFRDFAIYVQSRQ